MAGAFASGWLTVVDLTESERALADATRAHRWWEPLPVRHTDITDPPQDADWGDERTVRAQVLYQLLTGGWLPTVGEADWDIAPRAVRVRGARIVGQLDLEAATLRCPLQLEGCWLDHDAAPVLLREVTAPAIRIRGCWLPAGLDARQVTTRGDVDLQRCRVQGEVRLLGGHVGGQLRLSGGKFRNAGGTALAADGLQVDHSVFCREGFEADGEVRLIGGHVGGQMDLSGGMFRNAGGTALNAERVRVNGSLSWLPEEVTGRVSFAFGSVGVWADSVNALDTPVVLDRLQYDAVFPVPPEVTAARRVAWLNRDPDGYSPQPYSQLAAVYRTEGHDRAARQVLVASQARRRRQRSGWRGWAGRTWGGLLWATAGYGYRPWLALLWLAALIVGGALVVDWLPQRDFARASGAPTFNALLYTLDVLLPFIDLGYSKWVAVSAAQVVTVVLVVLGWVLATAVIAAFAGVLRRGD
jgi:hypothetical protein